MNQKIIASLLSLFIVFSLPALAAPKNNLAGNQSGLSTGPKKQVATIIFAGLAGAVLGLSTLSFYGRPQDKLPNIGVGFALGIIVGAGYTTYKAATQPKDFYGMRPFEPLENQARFVSKESAGLTPQFSYEWTF